MKKLTAIVILLCSTLMCFAQTEVPETLTVKLEGPRVGVSALTGAVADKLATEFGALPLITQFGWQFEQQYFLSGNGWQGLIEVVGLIGGIEQGLFLPSGSFILGMRNANGFEVGFGPNLSLSGVAFAFAIGKNYKNQYFNFPVNFALVPSKNSLRISLLVGINTKVTDGKSVLNKL